MAETNMSLIVMMVVAIVLLFTSMVLSSMASTASEGCPDENAHKYSMWSAIVTGVAALIIGVSLYLYINREPILSGLGGALKSAGSSLKPKSS